ncbi:hypothetical protein TcBrA4_0031540 [Trypanosoma cruzi]|nr:hypothetical protein TcBrA4_0031540 [Trypanosoma cruzi]
MPAIVMNRLLNPPCSLRCPFLRGYHKQLFNLRLRARVSPKPARCHTFILTRLRNEPMERLTAHCGGECHLSELASHISMTLCSALASRDVTQRRRIKLQPSADIRSTAGEFFLTFSNGVI